MKTLLLLAIGFYRRVLSPLKPYSTCKYLPTCSEYAAVAIQSHGPFRGTFLAVKRILRCNPFFRAKFDPVPPSHICKGSH